MRFRALTAISEMSPAEIDTILDKCSGFTQKTEAERENLRDYWRDWIQNPTVEIVRASELSEAEQREFIIKDNIGYGEWNMDMLGNEWDEQELVDWGLDIPWEKPSDSDSQGGDGDGSGGGDHLSLNEQFVVPPFSILDARRGYWQERKKQWYSLIGDMGDSRNDTLVTSLEMKYKDLYQKSKRKRKELGVSFREYVEKYATKEELEREQGKIVAQGVSILDPVMAELVCRWFGREGCKTFDCFAGDTVFGYVSAYLGNEFTGIELRPEQAQLNNERVAEMSARYINDDGQNVGEHLEPESQDLLSSVFRPRKILRPPERRLESGNLRGFYRDYQERIHGGDWLSQTEQFRRNLRGRRSRPKDWRILRFRWRRETDIQGRRNDSV